MNAGTASGPGEHPGQQVSQDDPSPERQGDDAPVGRSRGRRLLTYVGWFTTWLGAIVAVYEALQRLGLV